MQHLNVPNTPESRTPYVLALLAVIAVVNGLWRMWVGSPFAVEILIGVALAAVAYAVLGFVRQRR